MKHCDVAVVGAGTAGFAAAVTTARAGLKTLLIEQDHQPGGLVGRGNITTLCGLYSNSSGSPQLIYDGFIEEFIHSLMKLDGVDTPVLMGRLYVLPFRTRSFSQLVNKMLSAEVELETLYSVKLTGITVNKCCIENLVVKADSRLSEIQAGMVIDCSGDAVVARVAGQEILPDNEDSQSPAFMIPVMNVSGALKSPNRRIQIILALQHAAKDGVLPEYAANVVFMPTLDTDTVVLKISPGPGRQTTTSVEPEFNRSLIHGVRDIVAFLKDNVEEFSHSCTLTDAFQLFKRSSFRAVGRYVLKGKDVLDAAVFKNVVTRGCWPIEQWDLQGRQHLRYLPVGKAYDIPAEALQACAFNNLLLAGKTISADHDAIASARVIGCCLATGVAAGKMAVGMGRDL